MFKYTAMNPNLIQSYYTKAIQTLQSILSKQSISLKKRFDVEVEELVLNKKMCGEVLESAAVEASSVYVEIEIIKLQNDSSKLIGLYKYYYYLDADGEYIDEALSYFPYV